MATKKTAGTSAVAPTEQSARKIPLSKLRRSCMKLFGVSFSTFDGATVGLSGSYTVDEMKSMIDQWLAKEVW